MIDDIVFDTSDDFIYESATLASGNILGYSFDGNYFDFVEGTININTTGEVSSVFIS